MLISYFPFELNITIISVLFSILSLLIIIELSIHSTFLFVNSSIFFKFVPFILSIGLKIKISLFLTIGFSLLILVYSRPKINLRFSTNAFSLSS